MLLIAIFRSGLDTVLVFGPTVHERLQAYRKVAYSFDLNEPFESNIAHRAVQPAPGKARVRRARMRRFKSLPRIQMSS